VILHPKQAAKVAPISLIARSDFEPAPMVAAFEQIAIQTAQALELN
jgi:hypothetical protein